MPVPVDVVVADGFAMPAFEFKDLVARSRSLIQASHEIQEESKNLRAGAILARKHSRLAKVRRRLARPPA